MVGKKVVLRRNRKFPYFFINNYEHVDKKQFGRIIGAIDTELKYQFKDCERVPSYQSGAWDGYVTLLRRSKNGNYYFPSGYVDIVKCTFESFGEEVEVEDESGIRDYGLLFDWVTDKTLRDYQEDGVDRLYNQICDSGGGGLLWLPTGSGKTLMLCRLIYYFQQPTIVIVHTKDLLYQWKEEIKNILGVEAAVIGDGKKDEFRPVTIGMVQTLYRMVKTKNASLDYFNVMVADECHKCPSDTTYFVSMKCPAHVRIGATATPKRMDNAEKKMFAATGQLSEPISASELISDGYLAVPKFRFYRVPFIRINEYRKWNRVRIEGIVANEGRNQKVLESVVDLVKESHQVYVAVDVLDHGEILSAMIKNAGIPCVFMHGSHKSKERKAFVSQFKKGEIKVIVSTLLKEGVDIPEITAFVNAAGGKSDVALIQRVGRALRQNKTGDKTAVIVDFIDGGHKWLSDHWDSRWNALREYYGDHCPFPT